MSGFGKKACGLFIKLIIICFLSCVCHHMSLSNLTSLARNDADPVFSSLDPQEFLLLCQKLQKREIDWACQRGCHVQFSISPFGQNANEGKMLNGYPFPVVVTPEPCPTSPSCDNSVPLGDLTGRTNMLALLYGNIPQGAQLAPALQEAKIAIFGGIAGDSTHPGASIQKYDPSTGTYVVIDTQSTDPNINDLLDPAFAIPDINSEYLDLKDQNFGFFSFPLSYRKRGLAFDFEIGYGDVGLHLQTRVCSIRQTVNARINKTPSESFPTSPASPVPQPDVTPAPDPALTGQITNTQVNAYLMDKLDIITDQLLINIEDFIQTSADEFRASLFWRHLYDVGTCDREDWPHVFVVPFFELTGSFSPGKAMPAGKLFATPFGNNKHTAVGFSGGINFDFVETIEIGGEFGYTHFFERTFFDVPVPTSIFQNNLYPFRTDVNVNPGGNLYFAGKLAAYHFLDMLSMYFQYVVVEHKEDKIDLVRNKDINIFYPNILEQKSSFKTKLANIGFNYDISPNISLGFLWQAPLSQRNTYRSTTVMFTFTGTF